VSSETAAGLRPNPVAVVSIGKTAEEVHADLLAEGHDVSLAEVEEKINEMVELGFIQRADLSVGEAVEVVKEDAGRRPSE